MPLYEYNIILGQAFYRMKSGEDNFAVELDISPPTFPDDSKNDLFDDRSGGFYG